MIERSRVRVPAGAAGGFSSPGSTFCADSYFGIRSTPVLPQKHIKDPGHSSKSAGGSLQLYTHALCACVCARACVSVSAWSVQQLRGDGNAWSVKIPRPSTNRRKKRRRKNRQQGWHQRPKKKKPAISTNTHRYFNRWRYRLIGQWNQSADGFGTFCFDEKSAELNGCDRTGLISWVLCSLPLCTFSCVCVCVWWGGGKGRGYNY